MCHLQACAQRQSHAFSRRGAFQQHLDKRKTSKRQPKGAVVGVNPTRVFSRRGANIKYFRRKMNINRKPHQRKVFDFFAITKTQFVAAHYGGKDEKPSRFSPNWNNTCHLEGCKLITKRAFCRRGI